MSDIFRPLFRSVEDKVANRRDQLRKAQKTFRDRRDQYLRTLEKTTKRLHSNEAKLQNEVEHLKCELAATKSRLIQREADLFRLQGSAHGGINTSNSWDSTSYSSPANVAGWSPSYDSELESVNSTSSTLVWVETARDQPVRMHVHHKDDLQIVLKEPIDSNDTRIERVHFTTRKIAAYVFELDVAVVAMEFVLKLESPCLPHLRQADDSNSSSTSTSAKGSPQGHVHTASAALLCCSSHPSPVSAASSPSDPAGSAAWPVHKATLDRLLDISEDLPLDQAVELTPVQTWHCIAQSPSFYTLQMKTLDRMSDTLLGYIKCYGFGAVVKRDFLMKLISDMIR
ncbi:hypothetical protein H2200_007214 [Cladophialophora chaetospira]|uniref:BZIP domain-containing protein n=1 Tax=Cladophialophora chaetospira TaxID=386627 RepID=A0AA38X7I1_9EURO|nr:hypothetical protein H2200_007214 [Cladophialophora chaetospira]